MRNNIIYILACILIGFLSSCIQEDEYLPDENTGHNSVVQLSARLKGYTKTNVATRSSEYEFDPVAFENTIYNAFFLLFDSTDTLRIKGKATVGKDGSVAYNIGRDVLSIYENFKICFLANVSQGVIDGFTLNDMTWDDLDDYYLSIDYARYSEVGCAGVPVKADINGDGQQEYAMPMFGYKDVSRPYNPSTDYTISLERLFAKIEMNVALGIQADKNFFTSEPQFSLLDCEIVNIPKKAPIVKKTVATEYSANADNNNYASEEINAFTDFGYIIYSSQVDKPEYKSIYFYIPEHRLNLPASPSTTPAQKPTLVQGGNLRPVLAKISGFLTGGTGKTYNAVYSIYLGESNNDNFDLARNTKYINYVRLNGVSNPDVDHRVEIEEMDEMVDNLVGENGQTANCYIIEGNGTYMLPAYKGAYQLPDDNAKLCETGTNDVLYCDNPDITITIDHRLSKQSTIVFSVSGITTGSTDVEPKTGNAILVRYNDITGAIEWSWHLWFVGNNSFSIGGDIDLGSWTSNIVKSEALPDKTSVMDRNIGTHSTVWTANADVDLGLYYQYGKKEPYIDGSYRGGGTLDGNTSWNRTDKSPTDPCPVGYRVPKASTFNQSATKEHYSGKLARWHLGQIYSNERDVTVFRYWDSGTDSYLGDIDAALYRNDDIYFPYGYMNGSTFKNTETGSFTNQSLPSNYYREVSQGSDTNVGALETVTTEKFDEYMNVKYNISYNAYMGALLNNAGFSPFVTFANFSNITILSYDHRVRTEETKRTWLNPGGKKTTKWTDWSNVKNTQVSEIVKDIEKLYGVVTQLGSECDTSIISFNSNHGYQLRCVKE